METAAKFSDYYAFFRGNTEYFRILRRMFENRAIRLLIPNAAKRSMNIKKAREAYGLSPKLNFWQAECLLTSDSISGKEISNSKVYALVKKLADSACPTKQSKYDKRWENFYLPLRRNGKIIALPFFLMLYKRKYFAVFRIFGELRIGKGKDKIDSSYEDAFKEALDFAKIVKKEGITFLSKTVPYDIREGRIKGKYVLNKVMPKGESEAIRNSYNKHTEKQMTLVSLSLKDYLNVCAICYKAAFGKKAEGMKSAEMYKKWADGRDCGMLAIKDYADTTEFEEWLKTKAGCGGHPFEIVFSWHGHGIHLYPPYPDMPHYMLCVTNYAYASAFLDMLKALIKHNVPFVANDLGNVIEYLTGESYLGVNNHAENFILYCASKSDKNAYFKHIEWEELKIPELSKMIIKVNRKINIL